MGKVPTLVHHDGDHIHVVTALAAICHYLAEMHTEADLLPQHHEKADYFRLLFFAAGPIEQATTSRAMGWTVAWSGSRSVQLCTIWPPSAPK